MRVGRHEIMPGHARRQQRQQPGRHNAAVGDNQGMGDAGQQQLGRQFGQLAGA